MGSRLLGRWLRQPLTDKVGRGKGVTLAVVFFGGGGDGGNCNEGRRRGPGCGGALTRHASVLSRVLQQRGAFRRNVDVWVGVIYCFAPQPNGDTWSAVDRT